MKVKHGLLLLTLVGGSVGVATLVGCGPTASSSSSSSAEPVTPIDPDAVDADYVADLLDAAKEASVADYDYTHRRYQDSYIDGTIYTNEYENYHLGSFEGGYSGVGLVGTPEMIAEFDEFEFFADGKFAIYPEGDLVVEGFKGDSEDAFDWLNYNEVTPWYDFERYSNFLASVIDVAKETIVDPASVWVTDDPSYGEYVIEPFSFTIDEAAGTLTARGGATAEELEVNEYYTAPAEDHRAYAVFDLATSHLISIHYDSVLFDIGATELDIETETNNYTAYHIDNVVYGGPHAGGVEKLDPSSFDKDDVSNAPQHVVEGLDDGELSLGEAASVLRNLKAYAEGTSSLRSTTHYIQGYDEYWEETGPNDTILSAQLYNDWILDEALETEYEDVDRLPIEQHRQTYVEEEGISVVTQTGTEEPTGFLQEGDYVTSMNSFFNLSPIYTDYELIAAVNVVVELGGFGEIETDWDSTEVRYISGTKSGESMTIKFQSYSSSEWTGEETIDFELSFTGDFLSGFKYTSSTGDSVEATLGNAPLVDFDGELMDYEPIVY